MKGLTEQEAAEKIRQTAEGIRLSTGLYGFSLVSTMGNYAMHSLREELSPEESEKGWSRMKESIGDGKKNFYLGLQEQYLEAREIASQFPESEPVISAMESLEETMEQTREAIYRNP
jgi:RNA binding exosome subunit